MKTLSWKQIKSCVLLEDSSFIGCKVESMEGMWEAEDGTWESNDYIEGEGAREIVTNSEGIIIGFFGRYYEISSSYNGEK